MTKTKKNSSIIGFSIGFIYGIYPTLKAILLINASSQQGIGLYERLIQIAITITVGAIYGLIGMAIGYLGSIIYEKAKKPTTNTKAT